MRRLPHQGARHSTVDHGDASNGVFLLLHLWVLPSSRAILLANDLPPLLSLACGWPLGRMALPPTNGGASQNLGLKDLRVKEKGGRTDPRSGPDRSAWADGLGPSRPGSIAPPLPWVLMYLCTLPPPLAPF
jgi:hypothetical protein